MITIGQLASYAGVTIKAVRHYHKRGLLEEPPRDSSGYRRYTAQHAVDLVKIKTLAEAGVPLARVKELLAASPDRFAAAITEVDRTLQKRAKELRRTRERIARLSSGDRLFVSADVADYLDQLHELGVSQRAVEMERLVTFGQALARALDLDHIRDVVVQHLPKLADTDEAWVLLWVGGHWQVLVGTVMGPVTDGLGLMHAVTTYGDLFECQVTSCREMIPDTEFYMACLTEALEELKQAAGKRTT